MTVAAIRCKQPHMFFHEITAAGTSGLLDELNDLYDIQECLINSTDMGKPMKRPRRMKVGIHQLSMVSHGSVAEFSKMMMRRCQSSATMFFIRDDEAMQERRELAALNHFHYGPEVEPPFEATLKPAAAAKVDAHLAARPLHEGNLISCVCAR